MKKIALFGIFIGVMLGTLAFGLIDRAEQQTLQAQATVTISAATATSAPTVAATETPETFCQMSAYRMAEIPETSPMIFVYLSQGMDVSVERRENGVAWVRVMIGGTEMLAGVPDNLVICEEK